MNESEDILEQKILEKIEEIERPDYVFPPRFSKTDYLSVLISILVCSVFLIAGYHL